MNYELAKELKQNGFDQEPENFQGTYFLDEELGGVVYMPSLSELIEACEKTFKKLWRHSDGSWSAHGGTKSEGNSIQKGGQSAEDAVTNLWLAINKK